MKLTIFIWKHLIPSKIRKIIKCYSQSFFGDSGPSGNLLVWTIKRICVRLTGIFELGAIRMKTSSSYFGNRKMSKSKWNFYKWNIFNSIQKANKNCWRVLEIFLTVFWRKLDPFFEVYRQKKHSLAWKVKYFSEKYLRRYDKSNENFSLKNFLDLRVFVFLHILFLLDHKNLQEMGHGSDAGIV